MATYTKDVLRPGTFRVSESEAATFTKNDLERMAEQFNAMRETDDLSIPVPWEHPADEDPEGRPMTRKEREQHQAKFNAGWVNKLFVEGDVLKAEIDVPLEADAERIEKVGTFVSPKIGNVIAGSGKKWERVVKHVALTNKPVVTRQGKFEPVLAASLSRDISLSMADAVDSEETPNEGEAVSKQGGGEAGGEGEAQDPQIEEFRQAMLKLGVSLPEGLKVSGDLKVLIAAVANAAQGKGNAMSTDNATNVPAGNRGEPKEVQPQTVQLSREDADRLTKAEATNNALLAQVTGMKRAGYASRVKAAFDTGRCDKAMHDRLSELTTSFKFSVGEEEGKSELDIRLSDVEANPAGTFWSDAEKVVMLSAQEVTPAKQFQTGGEIDDERADAVVKLLHG